MFIGFCGANFLTFARLFARRKPWRKHCLRGFVLDARSSFIRSQRGNNFSDDSRSFELGYIWSFSSARRLRQINSEQPKAQVPNRSSNYYKSTSFSASLALLITDPVRSASVQASPTHITGNVYQPTTTTFAVPRSSTTALDYFAFAKSSRGFAEYVCSRRQLPTEEEILL